MKHTIAFFVLLLSLAGSVRTQQITSNFDSLVSLSVNLAEKGLYAAEFDNALRYVDLAKFEEFREFGIEHEVLLRLENIRIRSFKGILRQESFSSREELNQLHPMLPKVNTLPDGRAKAKYYSMLSSLYRSQNIDSCLFYESSALTIYEKLGDHKAQAELRATRISRELDSYLSNDEKELAISLIPKFKQEIEFSTKHSDYAGAYNTRHLANIYRIVEQDLDKALELYQQSLDLRKKIGFAPFIPASYYSVGLVYEELGMLDLAITEYDKAYLKAERVHFIRYEVRPLVKLGDIYSELGEYVTAKEYYVKALKVAARNDYSEQGGVDGILEKIDQLK